jgi:hypothetical protein
LLNLELSKGPRPARELFKAAEAEGISEKSLHAAKKELDIQTTQKKDGWHWYRNNPGQPKSWNSRRGGPCYPLRGMPLKHQLLSPDEERRLAELTEEFINQLPYVRGSILEAGRIARELKPLYVKSGRKGGWKRFVTSQGRVVRTVDGWILDYERSAGLRPPAEKKAKKSPVLNVAKSATFNDDPNNDDPDGYFAEASPEEQQFVATVSPEQISGQLTEALADAEDWAVEEAPWQPKHSHWKKMVQEHSLDYSSEPLVPIRTSAELKALHWEYLPQDRLQEYVKGDPVTRSTLRFSRYPDSLGGDKTEKIGLSFLLLKGVISEDVQERAREGLVEMDWPSPTRKETCGAASFNRKVPKGQRKYSTPQAGELTGGYTVRGGMIEYTKLPRLGHQKLRYEATYPLLQEMHDVFARVLPLYFGGSPGMEKQVGAHGANLRISAKKRQAVTTPASTITMLRSCPAALHTDPNGSHLGLACMTSVKGTEYTGGTFCLLEYGIQVPVLPGDLLIAATAREWHCNLTPVQGEKYSIVCYYRTGVDNPKMTQRKSVPSGEDQYPTTGRNPEKTAAARGRVRIVRIPQP